MAYDVITPANLSRVAVTAGGATVYTVPASKRAIVTNIDICNTTAGGITVDVHLVPSGASATDANALYKGFTVGANSILSWRGNQVLNPSDFIYLAAGGAGLTVHISGGEAV